MPPPVKIITGDCRDVLRSMRSASIDCVIADPPYGQTSLEWDKPLTGWAVELRRVLKPSGSMWVFGSLRYFLNNTTEFNGWRMSHDVVWEKHNGAGFFNDRFRTVHELAAHFYLDSSPWKNVYKEPQFTLDATKRTVRRKKTPAHWVGARNESHYVSQDGGPKLQRSVIYERSMHGKALHPTQKPEAIVELLLKYSCPPGGIVLDPFAGSGTTGLVAADNQRMALLIELNPKYVEIARKRLNGRCAS